MELNIDVHLAMVWDAVFDVQAKCYNLGVVLKVPVGKLDGIVRQYPDPSDQLREILKAWLRTSGQQTWQTLADALKSRIVGEPTLASDIEAKYCQGTPGQASEQPRYTHVLIQNVQQQLQASQDSQRQLQQQVMELKLQLQSSTQSRETTECLQRELQEQQQELHAKEPLQLIKQPATQTQSNLPQQMTLKKLIWRDGPKAPEAIYRGSVATDGTMVYFNGSGLTRVHQYHSNFQHWSILPDLPYYHSTLVMAYNKLTSVGGTVKLFGEATDSLLSLMGESKDRKWSQHFPPMTNKRYDTAAICHGRSLIVAGGNDGHNRLATVEVLKMDTQLWSLASSLPHPFTQATTSICGERLYLLGGRNEIGGTHSVLTCSISKLLHSCQTLSKSTIWRGVTDAPYKGSSCATLCGQLVAVGGNIEADKDTTAIITYNDSTNSWIPMDAMTTPRYRALVASLHDNTMMVVGGGKWPWPRLDTVEIAKVS